MLVSPEAYEAEIMAAHAEGREPADVEPPEDYEMSPAFPDWMVERLRGEVLSQISGAGLDRMAIVKDSSEDQPEE